MRVHVVDPPLFTLPYDQHLCRALASAGAEVTLIGRHLRAYEALAGEPFRFLPLFYRRSESRARAWRTGQAKKLLKGIEHIAGLRAWAALAAREQPAIVHVQWLVLPFLDRHALARLGRRAGLVLTVHDSVALHGAKNASPLQLVGDRDARLVFDHLIVHTEKTRAHLERLGTSAERVTVLPHPPLSMAAAAPTPAAAGAVPRILFFGSIKGYKGVDVLVEAGLQLAARGREFLIEIVGRPFEPLNALEAKITAAGAERHFRLDLRYVPDEALAAYLHAADLVVFPYREIDASGALALAAEAERPIIASAVGVFAEPPASAHLRLVPPGDATGLADAIDELLGDPEARAALREHTRQLKAAMGSWAAFASACLEVYAKVARARGGAGTPRL